jgi:hypothetical protein
MVRGNEGRETKAQLRPRALLRDRVKVMTGWTSSELYCEQVALCPYEVMACKWSDVTVERGALAAISARIEPH